MSVYDLFLSTILWNPCQQCFQKNVSSSFQKWNAKTCIWKVYFVLLHISRHLFRDAAFVVVLSLFNERLHGYHKISSKKYASGFQLTKPKRVQKIFIKQKVSPPKQLGTLRSRTCPKVEPPIASLGSDALAKTLCSYELNSLFWISFADSIQANSLQHRSIVIWP